MADINEIIYEIHNRRNAFLFDGEENFWCNGKDYIGCFKYQQCELIPESLKNKTDLTDHDKVELENKNIHCYRSTNIQNALNEASKYNPFGVRQKNSKFLIEEWVKNPCPIGGCITPEMKKNDSESNCNSCPFSQKARDDKFTEFDPNDMRFVQCYITQSKFRQFLKDNDVVVVAPLFREIDNKKEGFWYPFYRGNSFVQIPGIMPFDEDTGKIPAQMRWIATSIQRNRNINDSDTNKPPVFKRIEKYNESKGIESKNNLDKTKINTISSIKKRFVDVCDGESSWYMLMWILFQRKKGVNNNKWIYAEGETNIISELISLDFKEYLLKGSVLNLEKKDELYYRESSIEDDLNLLGLVINNKITERYNVLLDWLTVKQKDENTKYAPYLPNVKPFLKWNDLIDEMNVIVQNNEWDIFEKDIVSPLTPPLHIIVRYGLPPLRWVFIPLQTGLNNNLKDSGIHQKVMSGVIVLMKDDISSNDYKIDKLEQDVIDDRIKTLYPVISLIASIEEQNARNEISLKQIQLELEKTKHAIRAATAAIMARNMSHNIGSHVLSYLKSKLKSLPSIMEHNVLEKLITRIDGGGYKFDEKWATTITKAHTVENITSELETIPTPFLIGLGKFITYLQERQDFIATIATGYIPYFSSVPFKDFIYDEINYDYKAKRHMLHGAQLSDSEMPVDNILLDYIIRSEGKTRKQIHVNFQSPEGKDELFNGLNYEIIKRENDHLLFMRDIAVDLPGGMLGRQAIFSIFENLIRNAAKHGPKLKDLHITFKLEPFDQDYYKVTIYDNNQNAKTSIPYLNDKPKNDPLVDSNGKMIETNKGIKEIRISAAWLRNIDLSETKEIEGPDLLTFDEVEGNLAHVFYLFRSLNTVFVTHNTAIKSINTNKCRIYKPLEFLNVSICPRLVFLDHNINIENDFKLKAKLPPRYIMFTEIQANDFIKKISNTHDSLLEYEKNFILNSFDLKENNLPQISIIDKHKPENVGNNIIYYSSDDAFFENIIPEKEYVIFREHHESKSQQIKFYDSIIDNFNKKNIINPIVYAEGISGSNSTDRLIRRENLSEDWYLKMIESAYSRILIIDERLWSSVTQLSAPGPIIQKSTFILKINEILLNDPEERIPALKKSIDCRLFEESDFKELSEFLIKAKIPLLEKHPIVQLFHKYFSEGLNRAAFDLFQMKRISLLNIVEDSDNHGIGFYDLLNECKFSITYKNHKVCVVEDETKKENYQYDFILIHQGILDKIYRKFELPIKGDKEEDTKIINDFFPKLKNVLNPKKSLIVHSGRSEPYNLPEDTPFMQFSSLENAFNDCKFSLTELLYSSRVKQQL